MNNFTLAQKQQLDNLTATGVQVYYVGYDPTVTEPPTLDPSLTLFYSETSTNLVEFIYTSPTPQTPEFPSDSEVE